MKKYLFIIILNLLFVEPNLFAQITTFEKTITYDSNFINEEGSGPKSKPLVLNDSSFLISMAAGYWPTVQKDGYVLLKYDNSGNLIWKKKYFMDDNTYTANYFESIKVNTNKIMAIGGQYYPAINPANRNINGAVLMLNYQGDTVFYKAYEERDENAYHLGTQLKNKNIVLAGIYDPRYYNQDSSLFYYRNQMLQMRCIDTLGNTIWYRKDTASTERMRPTAICSFKRGFVITYSFSTDPAPIYTRIEYIDSAGNTIWQKYKMLDRYFYYGGHYGHFEREHLVNVNDSVIIYNTACTNSKVDSIWIAPNPDKFQFSTLIVYNENGDTIKTRVLIGKVNDGSYFLNPYYIRAIDKTQTGYVAVLEAQFSSTYTFDKIAFLDNDLNIIDTISLYKAFYTVTNRGNPGVEPVVIPFEHDETFITQASDGGYIYLTDYGSTTEPQTKTFLAKLNEHGYTTVGLKNILIDKNQEFVIYPNPANNIIRILNANTGLNYTMYNCQGQVLQQGVYKNEIDLTGLSSGIYIINLQTTENKYSNYKFVKQ